MARIRDKIAHFYFGIDYEIVWNVIKEKLPEIKRMRHLKDDKNYQYQMLVDRLTCFFIHLQYKFS